METKQSNNSATPMADAVKIANQRALFSLEWENDTVFKKRELNYKTKAAFQKDLEAGKISKYTTVFIKDSKEIYKNGQYYGAGSSSVVDITDIFNRMLEVVESGTVQQEDYNTLKSYILDNKLLKANIDGGHMIFDAMYSDSTGIGLQIYGAGLNEEYILVMKYSISKDLKLTYSQTTAPSFSTICNATLEKYVKQESYSSITPSDTINKAIGKLEASVGKIVTNGNGTKFLSDNGEYKEVSDTIINIDSIDGYTGKLSGITYSEIVDCIKKNKNIKVRMNMGGMGYIFTPISCVYIERSNLVTISIDTSLMQYANAYTKIVTLTIVNDNSYAISSVDKSVICENFANNGDISINLSYKGLSGQEEKSTSVTLKKTGDGTKFLSDDGTYKDSNKDSNIYFLPEKILDLKRESTSDDFLAVFGSVDNLKDVLNKSLNGQILAVKRNSTGLKYGGTQTISANITLLATAYYVSLGYFIPKTSFDTSTIFREIKFLISSESSGGEINNFSIKDVYHGGYKISANIYTLSDESTSDDISLVFTTADKLKELILAIIDGNRILINGTPKGYEDTTNMYGEYINNVETIACKIFDNGNMILTLKIFLCAYIAVQTNILMVEYNKSENKFSCKINKI